MEDILYIWLSGVKGIGPVLAHNLLSYFEDVRMVYDAKECELTEVDGIGPKIANIIVKSKNLDRSKFIYKYCKSNNINILSKGDDSYPKQLKIYKNAPLLLYVKGDLKQLKSPIAIVGSRRCTEYGKQVTIELAEKVVANDLSVVSGMAKGIDGYAHTSAIKNGGYTLAILGTGIDICYPNEHKELMNKIMEHGVVISQFPPGTTNIKENFIRRNETIAMLSDKIVVTQASKSSGSLYTAHYGMKYNKDVYAVPNIIYDRFNYGTNELISKGAKIYLGYESVVDKVDRVKETSNININNKLEKQIYELIKISPASIDRIKTILRIDSDKLDEIIFKMEIESKISQVGGVFIAR